MEVKGWVYVITNRAMPGLVKVGFSLKDPLIRAADLENAGVPYPFHVEYKILITKPREFEQKIHKAMRDFHLAKEWFECSTVDAIKLVDLVAGPYVFFHEHDLSQPNVSQNKYSQEDENLKARREREKEQREADLAAADIIKEKFMRRREKNMNK